MSREEAYAELVRLYGDIINERPDLAEALLKKVWLFNIADDTKD